MPKTTETRCRDGSVQATRYTKTTQVTPSLHSFLLQTAILNNLMACVACKLISLSIPEKVVISSFYYVDHRDMKYGKQNDMCSYGA